MGLLGLGTVFWALTDTMNPDAATLSKRRDWNEFDLKGIQPGKSKVFAFAEGDRRWPILVLRRTPDDIKRLRAEDWHGLRDPQSDGARVHEGHDEWLVISGVCGYEGCVLIDDHYQQSYGPGWACPCCGSRYDRSGRVRMGPPQKNLGVPQYVFLSNTRIRIDML